MRSVFFEEIIQELHIHKTVWFVLLYLNQFLNDELLALGVFIEEVHFVRWEGFHSTQMILDVAVDLGDVDICGGLLSEAGFQALFHLRFRGLLVMDKV